MKRKRILNSVLNYYDNNYNPAISGKQIINKNPYNKSKLEQIKYVSGNIRQIV